MRLREAASAQVNQGQDEGREREGAEAERRRICELAVLRNMQPGLQCAAEGRDFHVRVAVVVVIVIVDLALGEVVGSGSGGGCLLGG